MNIKQIKRGSVYRTTMGQVGRCEVAGGTTPPSVALVIVWPLPRGKVYFRPRDIQMELSEADVPPELRARLFPPAKPE